MTSLKDIRIFLEGAPNGLRAWKLREMGTKALLPNQSRAAGKTVLDWLGKNLDILLRGEARLVQRERVTEGGVKSTIRVLEFVPRGGYL